MRPAALIAPLAAMLGSCARDRAAPETAVPPAALVGEAQRCIPISLIRESRVRSGRVIDFVMRDARVFRNTLPSDCPGLAFDRRFAYATPLTQLCSVDVVTVLSAAPIQRGASCGLGMFQPVDPALARR